MKDSAINLLSGSVEWIENKKKHSALFDWSLTIGDNEQEIRDNFRYSETFIGRGGMDKRRRFRELEDKGLVRLVSFKVEKQLGRSCVFHTN